MRQIRGLIMGQEAGHRWLAFPAINHPVTGVGGDNADLLGRSLSHWSWFFNVRVPDSNFGGDPRASSAEGNVIEDLGPSSSCVNPGERLFLTARNELIDGFTELDQYFMGLRLPGDVGPFWYIDRPTRPGTGVAFPASQASAGAQDDRLICGRRVDLTIRNITDVGDVIMTPVFRKLALTTHITSSVGWLGSVAAFLALAIAGLSSHDAQTVRAAYLAMHLVTWFVIVPLSLASLLTGLIESLGTTWGLFQHYWVVTKLLLTLLATIILLLHTQPIDRVAAVAAQTALSATDLRQLRIQLVADAGAALFVLIVATTLSVYKPWGMTRYGLRKQNDAAVPSRVAIISRPAPPGRYVLFGIIGVVVLVLIWHALGGGLHGH